MSHWAELDENNVVTRVLVCDEATPEEDYDMLMQMFGGRWVQTSYNTFGGVHRLGGVPLRKNFAGIGYVYDEVRDAFISPCDFPSWVLNEETCYWEAPVAMPNDGQIYYWDETSKSWVLPDSNLG